MKCLLCLEGPVRIGQARFFEFVIRRDDPLHQRMAHHIAGGQAADGNVLHAVENLDCLFESADLVARQIDLRDIAGDDDLRAEAEAAC